jgi:hypothetical protein
MVIGLIAASSLGSYSTSAATIYLYSGVADPTCELSADEARELGTSIHALTRTGRLSTNDNLGYRGVVVELHRGLVTETYRLTNGGVFAGTPSTTDPILAKLDETGAIERQALAVVRHCLSDQEFAMVVPYSSRPKY